MNSQSCFSHHGQQDDPASMLEDARDDLGGKGVNSPCSSGDHHDDQYQDHAKGGFLPGFAPYAEWIIRSATAAMDCGRAEGSPAIHTWTKGHLDVSLFLSGYLAALTCWPDGVRRVEVCGRFAGRQTGKNRSTWRDLDRIPALASAQRLNNGIRRYATTMALHAHADQDSGTGQNQDQQHTHCGEENKLVAITQRIVRAAGLASGIFPDENRPIAIAQRDLRRTHLAARLLPDERGAVINDGVDIHRSVSSVLPGNITGPVWWDGVRPLADISESLDIQMGMDRSTGSGHVLSHARHSGGGA